MADRTIAVVRRIDAAIVVEAQVVRAVMSWSNRPIVADADTEQRPTIVVAKTRSRVPDGGSTAKIAGEVYTLFAAIISAIIR